MRQQKLLQKKMKKFLIISCIVLSFLGILISSSPFILKITGLDIPAKRLLLENIFSGTSHQFDLQKINIGLGKFEISEVSFKSSDKRLEVFVDEMILEFNIIEYLKSPTNFKKSLREIYFIKPQLIIHEKASGQKNLSGFESQSLKSLISELNFYKNLGIAEGQIKYQDKTGTEYIFAQHLNGWLSHHDLDNILLNVEGSSFTSDTENFKLEAEINNSSSSFLSNIAVFNYNFSDPSLELLIESIKLDGLANGSLAIKGNFEKLDSLNINGKMIISDLNIDYQEEYFSDIDFVLNVENNSISLDEGRFKYHDSQITLNVFMPDLYTPEITGNINSFNFPIAALEKIIPTAIFNGSKLNYSLDFEINANNYFAVGSVNSDNFSLYKGRFRKFETSVKISNEEIKFTDMLVSNDNLKVIGFANYSNKSNDWKINLNGDYYSQEHILFDNLSNADHAFDVDLTYNTKSNISHGKWNYLISGSDTILSAQGLVSGDSKAITASSLSTNFDAFNSKIKIADYLSNPNIVLMEISNFPFHVFSTDKIFKNIYDFVNTRVLLSGVMNDLNGSLEFYEKTSNEPLIILNTRVKDIVKENKIVSGNIKILNMEGSFGANINSTLLASHFYFDDGLKGELIIDLSKEDEEVNGSINIENLKIQQALVNTLVENDYRYQGEISGDVNISGSIEKPIVKGKLRGAKFVLNEIGYFQPQAVISLEKTSLKVDSIAIYHNNLPVVEGRFSWTLSTDQIDGVLKGSALDIETYLNTFKMNEGLITGTAAYVTQISGTSKQPLLETSFDLSDGELDQIKYDKLQVKLVDQIIDNRSLLDSNNHNIYLKNLNISRQGHFHLKSEGSIPLNSNDNIDFSVNFDGDILNLIPRWEPYFRDGASLADISLKLKGTKENPKLAAAEIRIDRGELWLESVAEHIENISGTILLKEGDNKIDIDLIAFVGEDYLKINTVRNITTAEGRELESWFFKGLDLDFGILAMQTSGQGVELNIPGLMLPSESGKIHLAGKVDQEIFYFAGPIKHPVAYGLVTLNNANITYPFISENKADDKRSTTVEFLSNIEWDATLKSGEDVLYARNIPAYFDNVFTEVTVDEKSPGLDFSGIIDKGTFKPVGSLISSRGRLEYLDLNFKVDRFTVDFFQNKDYPDVSGKAWTSIRDSVGAVPKTIYLQLYAIDEETGQIKQFGNWNEFKFRLVSADPTIGETQEQVLAYLGYSVENIKEKATNVGGALTDKYLIRPFLRPVEKILEKSLGVDLVRFNSKIAKNLFYSSILKSDQSQKVNPFSNPFSNDVRYLYLMSSSEVTVGKYLNENIYLTYTGQLVSVYDDVETGYDMNHSLGVEYRFYKNILLEFEWDRELMRLYDYANQRQYLDDFKIRFRHSFSF